MKILSFLVMVVLISSCGLQKKKKVTSYNVHPALQPYVTTFSMKKAQAGQASQIVDLEAHFSDTIGTVDNLGLVIGVCIRSKKTTNNGLVQEIRETPVIKVNRQWWETASDEEREQLMYHELGHCILKRDHTEVMLSQNEPKSIMYPIQLSTNLYTSSYGFYISELFNSNATTTAVAFAGLSFDDSAYASRVAYASTYKEVVEDDSHYTSCVHDKEDEIITAGEASHEHN